MRDSKPYFIAEIGVNYYDTAVKMGIKPIEAAKLYIDRAFEAGVDCVKFQSYKAEHLASKFSPAYWDTTKETTQTQYELFKKFDHFGEKEYADLSQYAHKKGMDFTSTPFDYSAADYLYDLVDFYKISSSDISNLPFLRYIAAKQKKVLLSLGASYLHEVEEAIKELKDSGAKDIVIMHCVLSYPTSPENANLSVIRTLKRLYPENEIGYSDHVPPDENMVTLLAAYLLGATYIEKHFTLDKTLQGNDHYHAGDPNDFRRAIDNCHYSSTLLGNADKTVLDCEKVSRKEARRSLVLTRDMKVGDIIRESDIEAKRPGTGIEPRFRDFVIGKSLKTDLVKDTVLKWDMI